MATEKQKSSSTRNSERIAAILAMSQEERQAAFMGNLLTPEQRAIEYDGPVASGDPAKFLLKADA